MELDPSKIVDLLIDSKGVTMGPVEIRIKRNRTSEGDSTLELFERWASLEGRSLANGIQAILEGGPARESWTRFLDGADREARRRRNAALTAKP